MAAMVDLENSLIFRSCWTSSCSAARRLAEQSCDKASWTIQRDLYFPPAACVLLSLVCIRQMLQHWASRRGFQPEQSRTRVDAQILRIVLQIEVWFFVTPANANVHQCSPRNPRCNKSFVNAVNRTGMQISWSARVGYIQAKSQSILVSDTFWTKNVKDKGGHSFFLSLKQPFAKLVSASSQTRERMFRLSEEHN